MCGRDGEVRNDIILKDQKMDTVNKEIRSIKHKEGLTSITTSLCIKKREMYGFPKKKKK